MPLAVGYASVNESAFAPSPVSETELDRLLKFIPTELIAFYAAAVPISADVPSRYFPFVLFLIGVALVPVVLYLDGRSTKQLAPWLQYAFRTLAFVAWAIAIAWPFEPWASAEDLRWVRSLAVIVVPFVGAFIARERPADPDA
jgi:hypothetical protein